MRLILLSLLCATASCFAETFPKWNVYSMCADADAIIIGSQVQGDTVAVTKWIKGAPASTPRSIVVTDIGKLSKSLYNFKLRPTKQTTRTLATHHFMAFLERKNGNWRSMATIEHSGLFGSCGMIWIQDGRCYRYAQAQNPGPYRLSEAMDLKTEKELFQAIEVGLKANPINNLKVLLK